MCVYRTLSVALLLFSLSVIKRQLGISVLCLSTHFFCLFVSIHSAFPYLFIPSFCAYVCSTFLVLVLQPSLFYLSLSITLLLFAYVCSTLLFQFILPFCLWLFYHSIYFSFLFLFLIHFGCYFLYISVSICSTYLSVSISSSVLLTLPSWFYLFYLSVSFYFLVCAASGSKRKPFVCCEKLKQLKIQFHCCLALHCHADTFGINDDDDYDDDNLISNYSEKNVATIIIIVIIISSKIERTNKFWIKISLPRHTRQQQSRRRNSDNFSVLLYS